MNFDRVFFWVSYGVVLCGFFALWVSGTFGIGVTSLFLGAVGLSVLASRRDLLVSEKVGTGAVVVLVPIFYFAWRYRMWYFQTSEAAIAGMLARMILVLCVLKLFQRKADRDWLFLYLMAFFEVLLGAALSVSPMYLASLVLFLFTTVLAIVIFDIRKSRRLVAAANGVAPAGETSGSLRFGRLPTAALVLLLMIAGFAGPMFFMLPRVGGAGIGASQNSISGFTGFSDRVRLGEIGKIQRSTEVVMRVRIEGSDDGAAASGRFDGIKWRGVALDRFDNKTWSKSQGPPIEPFVKSDSNAFRLDYASGKQEVTVQTVYLEPIETDVLFGLWRPVAVQGNFQVLRRDVYGGVTAVRNSFERVSYRIYSDRWTPDAASLRRDNTAYNSSQAGYLQIPDNFDARIGELAASVAGGKSNRFDKAKAIETYLQTQFGYTLEQKAGGDQPLADFLFNIREGHCEYFATAMVMMLRTQGIAARVVNGFQRGEYNATANMYVVRQKDAHSWVEVYFPRENSWVTFDPTPSAGAEEFADEGGITAVFGRYMEALEAFWIQYFVSFDNQEQQSLFRSVKSGFNDYQAKLASWLGEAQSRFQEWWSELRGAGGVEGTLRAVGRGLLYLGGAIGATAFAVFAGRRIGRLGLWTRIAEWLRRRRRKSIVEFYDRMERTLAARGLSRTPDQTPLEFAFAVGMPEAVSITEKYQRVRFGEVPLSDDEASEIESWLRSLEKPEAK